MWEVNYENDVPIVGSYTEWWEVTDGKKAFNCCSEEDAQWLCGLLNSTTYKVY